MDENAVSLSVDDSGRMYGQGGGEMVLMRGASVISGGYVSVMVNGGGTTLDTG